MLRVRWFVRAPVGPYRARLGFMLGSRMLMLEHTGRKSGARRHVVLEVVASGFGDRAQWFRNVRADPRVRVYAGSRRPARATARLLSAEESAASLAAYAARRPRAWAQLKPVMEATLGARIDAAGTTLPMIALDLAPDAARADRQPRSTSRTDR